MKPQRAEKLRSYSEESENGYARIFDFRKRSASYPSAFSAPLRVFLLMIVAALTPAKAAAAISYIQGTDTVKQNTATLTAT
jgi:hypothetical protein